MVAPRKNTWLFAASEFGFMLIAAASILAAILLSLVYIPALPPGAIHWPMLVILFWATYQPRWQPMVLIFIMGIVSDLLSGNPLVGITSFLGVFFAAILRSQNHLMLALPFRIVWLIAAGLIFCWRGIEVLASGVLQGIWPLTAVWLSSVFLTTLCFPLAALILSPLRRAEFRF